jgi:hypothetical protein
MVDFGRWWRVERLSVLARSALVWVASGAAASAAACGADAPPCVCPAAPPCVASPSATTGAAPDLWAARRPLAIASASAGLALDTAENLFRGRFEAVRRLLQPELGLDLTTAKLGGIVDGLIKAHGSPVEVMDAWASEIREKEVMSPAAEALIRMQSGKRIGLLLVFDPQGAVRGLWLRPI